MHSTPYSKMAVTQDGLGRVARKRGIEGTCRTRQLLLIINTKKIAFPTDGWGTALAKVHYLPVRK